ncbi:hypothetical protein [Portibacter lacus]|uniref:Uncharacterized protein n=1 Tax=Portibacter lacus TaxID=1099794 RepID=A0AA37WHK5_9BACT|nr:hypothetical protein [Portibacter lacus]GLR19484.1 hypothetical protein GCM10007940_41000 [Portibacter lacus]
MKYLIITCIIGSHTFVIEVTQDYIYHHSPDPLIGNAYFINRSNDTLYNVNKGKVISKEYRPNEKQGGEWGSGVENIVDYEMYLDSDLGNCFVFNIEKTISNDNDHNLLKNSNKSQISKYYISIENDFIRRYFFTNGKLEYRILSWNNYGFSDYFPFLIRIKRNEAYEDPFKILQVTFEEKEIDANSQSSKILDMISNYKK